jgi:hypothetical protein
MTQLFLFTARFFPWLTQWVGRWVWWLQSDGSVAQDDGYKVYTFDCLVSRKDPEGMVLLNCSDHQLTENDLDPIVPAIHDRMGDPV